MLTGTAFSALFVALFHGAPREDFSQGPGSLFGAPGSLFGASGPLFGAPGDAPELKLAFVFADRYDIYHAFRYTFP